ncbi:SDR family NAD(P)-dependent oxidoreductase [Vulgatibacter sp.]|uniref:SDR family NAD(P)-dependent oxidoreductase n=1 Tax=Vulgatibacter sp. TaxID=1971226 RepID=UPI003563D82A
MADFIITGASRGIGHALALELAGHGDRLVLVARDEQRLEDLAAEIRARGGEAVALPGDLSALGEARALGGQLAAWVEDGASLIHNAGLWPSRRTLTVDGFETAFAVNHLGPLALQEELLASGKLRRVLVNSAGLLVKGRFDPERTPSGADFSAIRTYATTKLCFAIAMREVAAEHPAVDVLVVHPGVVRTDLGQRPGPLGWLLERVKRRWEAPEVCAARLARILARERWSPPGVANWQMLEEVQPWPAVTEAPATRQAIRAITARILARPAAAAAAFAGP